MLQNTKVYSVLSKFDKYEQNRCRKYIQSPYFNANEKLVQLYELIICDINKLIKKPLLKQVIWRELHGNEKKYDNIRLRKYISDLLKLVEGYLSQQFYESNPLTPATHLVKAVELKNLNELYKSSIRNVKSISEKRKSLSADYFLHQYWIESYSYEIMDYDSKRDQKSNHEDIMTNLDQFFLVEKLKLYCGILSRKYMSAHDYDIKLIEEIIKYVSKNLQSVEPNVEIYYRISLTHLNDKNIDNFYKLKQLLSKYSTKFSQEEAYHIYLQVINYCIKWLNIGEYKFLNEIFDLYQDMIETSIVYENGELSPSLFKNIMSVASRLEKFTWAEDFIQTNASKLPEDQRENVVTFNLAMLYFMQKKYEQVVELLRDVEYSEVSLSLQSKTMLLMTYYDTDEFEPLDSLLESFRVYLNRHKEIPKHRIDYHKNLIKFTKKLTRTIRGDREAVAKIKEEIEATEGFRVKWLEEKIAELEG